MKLLGMRLPGILAAFLVFAAVSLPGLAVAEEIPTVQPPLTLEAAKFVPDALMTGKDHQVQPQATNDGLVNTYTLQTEWGQVTAVGDYRLRARINEVNALKTLDEMSRAGVFGDKLVDGVLAPVEMVVDLVSDPVDTVGDAVDGVGRWFGNIAQSATSDDPYQEGALSSAAGWAATKRAYAVELNVDPYTDWEPLQEALVSVGRAAFAGGITASVAMGAAARDTVVSTPLMIVNVSDRMRKILVDNPPERLADMNRADLQDLGVENRAIESLIANHHYSPMEKLLLVDALKRMKGAKDLGTYVAYAATAPDKDVARYVQQRAEMMARLHAKAATAAIVPTNRAPLQKLQDGRIVGVYPLDYVAWTPELGPLIKAANEDLGQVTDLKSKELWIEGTVSPEARKGFEAQGWAVKDRVQLLLDGSS